MDGDGGGGVNGDDGGGCGGYDCDDDQKRLKCLTMRRSQSALRTFVWRVDTGAGSTRNRITGGLQIVDQFNQSSAVITQKFQQNNRITGGLH